MTSGSPPRMRGKQNRHRLLRRFDRITPAHAGKTTLRCHVSPSFSDHPRVCGENHSPLPCEPELLGSPPRVRGKLGHIARDSVCDGITPACAGKTQSVMWRRRAKRDHPRVCGENAISPRHAHRRAGSPPRVRGKPVTATVSVTATGITPACAGKTTVTFTLSAPFWDHPRVCGENRVTIHMRDGGQGSPPRVRGKPGGLHRAGQSAGITPACAGKTSRRCHSP